MATKARKKTADRGEVTAVPFLPPGVNAFLRKSQVVFLIGASLTTFKGMRARKEFPDPDDYRGKLPVWTVETVNAWIAGRVAENRKARS